jgi:Arc/MetJ-type ribon-helix-helix transcriptional regulator
MKIVTVNVPESYIDAIKTLIGDGGLYPSRSELVRVAVRKFLIKELKMAKRLTKMYNTDIRAKEDIDEDKFVRIPVRKKDKNGDEVREFQTLKIVERLE